MAVMNEADRVAVFREFMQELSNANEPLGNVNKQQLRDAVNAVDQWVSDNAASLNLAMPQPARGVLTTAQKARLLAAIVLRRFTKGV